jgi:uncharacterized membrane protein
MGDNLWDWLRTGHLIGVVLWVASMTAVYWLLRVHVQAPKESHERLTLMERSLALTMDLSATLAMGCGIARIFVRPSAGMPNLLAQPGAGWFHIKLLVVVVTIMAVHGMLRARIKKFGMGQIKPVPQWQWTALLAGVTAIILLVTQGPRWFAKTPQPAAKVEPAQS